MSSYPRAEHSFLVESFKDFFREVMLHKRAIEAQATGQSEGIAGFETIAVTADAMAKQLMHRLDQQNFDAFQKAGEMGVALMKEAQYAMVALADEIFLGFEWPDRKAWEARILEERVFQTHAAGEHVFDAIERLLSERQPDRTDVGAVYLMALGLGFRGQFASEDDHAKINEIKQRLFVFAQHRRPRLYENVTHLFAEAERNTIEDEPVRFFHDVRKWHIFLGVAALSYMIMTTAFWYNTTRELGGLARKISRESGLERS